MSDKSSISVVAAYTPEEYEKIFSIAEDRDGEDKGWEEWRRATDEKKAEAATQGVEYVEQYINAEGLLKYCLATARLANAQARTAYAKLLYAQERNEPIVPSDKPEQEERPPTPTYSYMPPVDKLLTYTDIKGDDPLPKISYAEQFGIGPEHISELIRMATDAYLVREDSNDFEFTAPLHAVSALAELRAEAAIDPLLTIYDKASKDENEWMLETLVDFYTIIGPVALPSLEQFLADPLHDNSAQNYVAEIIGRIAGKYPEVRTECVAVATRRLSDFEVNDPELNAALISALIDMKAVESAPVIEAAYASGRVDSFWGDDWDDAQYELGLKERPAAAERPNFLSRLSPPTQPTTTSTSYMPTPKAQGKGPASKKVKTKMAKASKKANRRKK